MFSDLFTNYNNKLSFSLLCIFLFITSSLIAQTTGKLAGRVTDDNGEPLIGANVLIEGTNSGGATDIDGYYSIINIRTGTYRVRYGYVGYQTKIIDNVIINSDRTTKIDIALSMEVIEG
ncbi:MAG: carboxypeptidase-like regulatory domain-containing protein, partial [Melioribacteraceae bacterium]|nr:carboxypeptidase-like regulatory domain-containing protein [Melioribacteraceae bacterium]